MKSFSPCSTDAEFACLGCALNSKEAAELVAGLDPNLFVREKHRHLYRAIRDCIADDEAPDLITVVPRLKNRGVMAGPDDQGGSRVSTDDLVNMTEAGPVPQQAKQYAAILKALYEQRQIIKAAEKILARATEGPVTFEELADLKDEFQQTAFDLTVASDGDSEGLRPLDGIMGNVITTLEARYSGRISPHGVESGFGRLDRWTTGFHAGELIVIAARPGMGKTSLALNIALHAAGKIPVCFFSLEMSAGEIGQRLLARKATLNLRDVRTGQVHRTDFDRIVESSAELAEQHLYVDDSATISPIQIRSGVRQWAVQRKEAVGLVVVDYLQIMSPSRRYDNREREVASISREMKAVAKDLNVPVILLSQLNRQLEQRRDKRPVLADLRESGAIEQDADCVCGLYQPYPYTDADEDRGKAECIILKQRNGPVGTVDLEWVAETCSFWDPSA